MQITTERLALRPVEAQDIDSLYRIYGDPATNAFNPVGPLRSQDEARVLLDNWLAHWQRQGFGNMVIALRHTTQAIVSFGGFGLREFGGRPVNNLGYRLETGA
ncbi:GNAT family N-acetyltransferase|nr:GNAT family N-acetyltransferase [Candidatus Pantoea persica]